MEVLLAVVEGGDELDVLGVLDDAVGAAVGFAQALGVGGWVGG